MIIRWEVDLPEHPKLGKLMGHGMEQAVYHKDGKDYVYKIYGRKITNIFKFIRTVYRYLDSRNSIPYLMPCRFVGIALCLGYMFPIFKLKKVEPLNGEYELPKDYRDARPSNFGIYDGKVVAIDLYKYKI